MPENRSLFLVRITGPGASLPMQEKKAPYLSRQHILIYKTRSLIHECSYETLGTRFDCEVSDYGSGRGLGVVGMVFETSSYAIARIMFWLSVTVTVNNRLMRSSYIY